MSDTAHVRAGLTLVEMLVALAVSVVVISATAAALQEVVGYEARARTDERRAFTIERLRRALSADLKGLSAMTGPDCLAIEEDNIERRPYARLTMATESGLLCRCDDEGIPVPLAGIRRVTYVCRREGDAVTLVRVESAGAGAPSVAVPVLRGLLGFALEPMGSAGTDPDRVAPDGLRVGVTFDEGTSYSFAVGIHATHETR